MESCLDIELVDEVNVDKQNGELMEELVDEVDRNVELIGELIEELLVDEVDEDELIGKLMKELIDEVNGDELIGDRVDCRVGLRG